LGRRVPPLEHPQSSRCDARISVNWSKSSIAEMKFEPLKTRPVQRLGFYFGILLIQVVYCRGEIRAVKNSSDVFVVCLVGFYCDVRPLLFYCDVRPLLFYCREMYGFIEIFSGLWVIPWYVTTVVQIALWSKIDLSFSNLFSLISGILFNGILLIWFCFFLQVEEVYFYGLFMRNEDSNSFSVECYWGNSSMEDNLQNFFFQEDNNQIYVNLLIRIGKYFFKKKRRIVRKLPLTK